MYSTLFQFSMDLFETLHTCCRHHEDVHVDLDGARVKFLKNNDLSNFILAFFFIVGLGVSVISSSYSSH